MMGIASMQRRISADSRGGHCIDATLPTQAITPPVATMQSGLFQPKKWGHCIDAMTPINPWIMIVASMQYDAYGQKKPSKFKGVALKRANNCIDATARYRVGRIDGGGLVLHRCNDAYRPSRKPRGQARFHSLHRCNPMEFQASKWSSSWRNRGVASMQYAAHPAPIARILSPHGHRCIDAMLTNSTPGIAIFTCKGRPLHRCNLPPRNGAKPDFAIDCSSKAKVGHST